MDVVKFLYLPDIVGSSGATRQGYCANSAVFSAQSYLNKWGRCCGAFPQKAFQMELQVLYWNGRNKGP